MSWAQRLASLLFGWQYVLFQRYTDKSIVCRARCMAGVYYVKVDSGTHFTLTKETMAPNAIELQLYQAYLTDNPRLSDMSYRPPPKKWRWAGLTDKVVTMTLMLPDMDQFKPSVTIEKPFTKLKPGRVLS